MHGAREHMNISGLNIFRARTAYRLYTPRVSRIAAPASALHRSLHRRSTPTRSS